MAYNLIYTADGLVRCVSDEYLEHKYDQYDAIDRKKKLERTKRAIQQGKNLRRWQGEKRQSELDKYQKARDASSNAKSISREIGIRNSETESYQKARDASAKAKKAAQDAAAAKRKRLKIDATGLKAASGAAVNYLDQNGWTRSKVNSSDGMNKCIFIKTINGKTKAFDIPIAVFEDSLIKRAEQTGFSISKYADAIRSKLKEAKRLDKLFPDARSK